MNVLGILHVKCYTTSYLHHNTENHTAVLSETTTIKVTVIWQTNATYQSESQDFSIKLAT